MTGPEHYAAAEELLGGIDWSEQENDYIQAQAAQAQAHATLALAASTLARPLTWEIKA